MLPRSHRLSGKRAFRVVFDEGVKASKGALTVFAQANGLPHPRLGRSVGRGQGGAGEGNPV